MPITDADIIALPPRRRPYKVSIGRDACLLIKPDGKKYWRLARDAVKVLIMTGIKPVAARREEKLKRMPREPFLRLGLSTKGALSTVTDTHVMTFTPQQTEALAAFLAKLQKVDGLF